MTRTMLCLLLCAGALANENPLLWSVTADLDAGGRKETVPVNPQADPCMTVSRGRQILWQGAPRSWQPWKLRVADVEGDGQREIILGVHKATRFFPRPHNCLVVLDWDGRGIGPKWMRSSLARPFVDFEFLRDGRGGDWLIAVEITRDNRRQLHAYHWDRFGFVDRWRGNEHQRLGLGRLPDGSLLLAADFNGSGPLAPPGAPHAWADDPVNSGDSGAWLYRSSDNGRSWTGPQKTYCLTVSLTMKQLRNGAILLGGSHYHCKGDYWSQVIYYSKNNGKTWYGPLRFLDDPNYPCGEGDIVEMPGGELIMYVRNVAGAVGSFKMISDDSAMTWQGPYAAGRGRIVGRVSAGLLKSGEVLVMHRVNGPLNREGAFGFFVETPEAALSRIPYDVKKYKPTAKSCGIIDVDRNSDHPDNGYGGWVELPDGDIYAVR